MTRGTALALTVLTGFSGLVYEVAWQKYLAALLGSHSEATAAVLAIFLGGLAAGYWIFGAVTRGIVDRARRGGGAPRLFVLYGLVEAGIGFYALLFPPLFGFAQTLSFLVPSGHETLGFAFDLLLSTLLIGPPTVLMGGTIPVLTQALSHDLQEATRVHARVYAFNTAGAFAGALAGGFALIPLLGLDGVLHAMGLVNLGAGCGFLLLERFGLRPAAVPLLEAAPRPSVPLRFAGYAAVALLAGFAMMSVQTVLNRIGALAFGASHFTFSMVVAVFVLCIALGSFAVSALPRIPAGLIVGSQWILVAVLGGLYLVLPDAPYWAHVLRSPFRDLDVNFYPYHVVAFLGVLAVFAVPIGLSGALLPLLFHHLRREMGDLGAVAGRLYSWNTVGSLLGAVLGGYAFLFWVDLDDVYRIALGALAIGAAVLSVLVLRVPRIAAGLATLLCGLVLLLQFPSWPADRLASGLFRLRSPTPQTFDGPDAFFQARAQLRTPIFHRDDPTSTVTVVEWPRTGEGARSILTNGKSDGNVVADYSTMALAALLPALLAADPERAFVIGWGTGITAGEFAALEDTREVMVAEISAGVIEAAPLFDHGNLRASKNPKVRILRSDAYRALLRSEGSFGAIASEPSNPWVTGVEMLYSREFLAAARERLAPGGVYAQWFHLYEIDIGTLELVLRTYASVFDHVSVWYTMGHDVLLLGFDSAQGATDLQRIEARFRRADFAAGFGRAGIESFEALLAHEVLPLGTLHAAQLAGEIHTLRHPILSHRAARAFFLGRKAELPRLASLESARVGLRNSLLRRYAGTDRGPVPEAVLEVAAAEACSRSQPVGCATFLARWRHDHPGSKRLARALGRARQKPRLVKHLRGDELAKIAALHGGSRGAEPGGDPLIAAAEMTSRFARFYHHAIPFDRAVLARAWNRCETRTGRIEACSEGRSRAEAMLGSLSAAAPSIGRADRES